MMNVTLAQFTLQHSINADDFMFARMSASRLDVSNGAAAGKDCFES